jgi:hypothetical protein
MAEQKDQKAAAGYLAELAREMRLIAERHDLKVLSYLLGLVEADAQVQANQDLQAHQDLQANQDGDQTRTKDDPARPARAGCDTPEGHR